MDDIVESTLEDVSENVISSDDDSNDDSVISEMESTPGNHVEMHKGNEKSKWSVKVKTGGKIKIKKKKNRGTGSVKRRKIVG